MTDHEQLEVRGVVLQSGVTLENVTLAYKTYGTLNRRKDNVIVYPTYFAGRHQDNEWLIGGGRALDPARYFIIVPNMFGNGLSTSPSNVPPPHNCGRFPNFTTLDNVRLQHQLLTEKFSIDEIALAVCSIAGHQDRDGVDRLLQLALCFGKMRLALPQCLLGALASRHIHECTHNLDKFAACGELGVSDQFDMFDGPCG